jgi:uncharacterized protein YjdB/phage tail protein X
LLALAACGGDGGEVDCDPIAATLVSRIEVSPATPVLADGESLQLSAVAFSCDGSQLVVPSFTWQSADATTVSVNASGMAVGVKVGGPVSVTATAQGKQGSARVSVTPRAVASVRVEPATASVAVGRTSTFTARAFDAQGGELPGRTATWSSANSEVASVTQAGAVSGVAVGGPIAITATIDGQSGSSQVSVVNAAVASVTVTPPSASIGAGTSTQLTAVLRDDAGNILTGRAVLWTTTDAVRTSVSQTGLVTGLVLGGPVTILATSEGRSGESQVTVVPGTAARLAFTVQPASAVAGRPISPDVRVQVQDALGNRIPGSTISVTVALNANPGSGVLSGTRTVSAVDGVATFGNLLVDRTGVGYTLAANATGLTGTVSTAFNVTPAAAARVVYLVPPSSTASGAEMVPAVQVEVRDALGNRVTTSTANVTVALDANPGLATLGGTLTVPAVAGVATFSTLTINRPETGYTLVASSAGLINVTSAPFAVTPGAPAALVFTVQPSTVVAGTPIAPAIQVEVRDMQGNLVSTATSPVTLSLSANPGAGILSGTLTVNAVNGVATFNDISVNLAAAGYAIAADSPELVGTVSTAFDVTPGVPVRMIFLVQPMNTDGGDVIAPPVQVEVQDLLGNRATNLASPFPVTIDLRGSNGTSNPMSGSSLAGTVVVDASGGVTPGLATYSDLVVNEILGRSRTVTLRARASNLPDQASAQFQLNP